MYRSYRDAVDPALRAVELDRRLDRTPAALLPRPGELVLAPAAVCGASRSGQSRRLRAVPGAGPEALGSEVETSRSEVGCASYWRCYWSRRWLGRVGLS